MKVFECTVYDKNCNDGENYESYVAEANDLEEYENHIKGFGITLFIGIIISMLSAIFVTKFLLKQMIGMNVKNLWFYGII